MGAREIASGDAPGLIDFVDGVPVSAFSFAVVGGRISGIYAIANPGKLRLLPPPE